MSPVENMDQSNPDSQNTQQQQPLATPTVAFDPRFDSFAQEMRETNNKIFELLQQRNSPPSTAPPPPPEFNEDDFRERPLHVMTSLVDHSLSSRVEKLKSDILGQLSPINNFIASSQRTSLSDTILQQVKANPAFSQLSNPQVEAAFKQQLLAYQGEININVLQYMYFAAVGIASSSPGLPPTPAGPSPVTPAHARPTPTPGSNSSQASLPPLDKNQERLRAEKNWSHAKACYMFNIIPYSTYHKLEPDGKKVPD